MNETTTTRHPKRKRQPTAECMRQQLALAADEIIRLRGLLEPKKTSNFLITGTVDRKTIEQVARAAALSGQSAINRARETPWWRRILGRWFV